MKYCENCKRNYPDNQVFCSECGNRLKAFSESPSPSPNPYPTPVSNNNMLVAWIPVILSGIGALVGWFLSGLIGLVFGVCGVVLAIQHQLQDRGESVAFFLTWILAIVDVVFWIIAMTA